MKTSSWQSSITHPQMWVYIAMLSLMIMELSLVSLWYQALFRSIPLVWPAIFAILGSITLISYGLSQVMQSPRLSILARQAIFLGWLVLAILVSLRIMVFAGYDNSLIEMLLSPVQYITLKGADGKSFFHILGIVLIAWRGVALARSPITLRDIQVSFQLGLILLMFYGMTQAPSHPTEAGIGLYIYLFFALVSMSAARIASLSSERGGRVPRFGKTWFAGILLAGLGFVGLAVLTGWLAGSRLVDWILRAMIILFTAINSVLLILLTPLFSLLSRAISNVFDLIKRLVGQIGSINLPKFIEDLFSEVGQFVEQTIPFVIAGRGVILTALLVLTIAAVLLGLRFRTALRRIEEEQDSDQIRRDDSPNLLQKLAKRLFSDGINLHLRSPGQILAAARIRQIYRKLITLSRQLGVDRPPPVTPLEFLPRLVELFPENGEGLEQITQAYLRIRYGQYPEILREVNQVQLAWDSIRQYSKTRYKK